MNTAANFATPACAQGEILPSARKAGAVAGQCARVALMLASSVCLLACQTVQTTRSGAVGVERSQRMAISSERIDSEARQQYQQIIQLEQRKGRLNANPGQLARVRRITERIIPQTAVFRPEAPRWEWEVNVITSNDVNAWCMPGGKIAVYTGLIDKLNITDDELAAVLGHEIAHALREHARERASEQAGTQILANVIDIIGAAKGIQGAGKIASTGLQLGIGLPNSREHETEADRIGIELAARAGYNPQAAVVLWQKMAQVGGGQPLPFLSTHPAPGDRQNDLRAYAQRVMPLYEKSR